MRSSPYFQATLLQDSEATPLSLFVGRQRVRQRLLSAVFPLLIGAAQHIDTSHWQAGGPALAIECPHQGLAITAEDRSLD